MIKMSFYNKKIFHRGKNFGLNERKKQCIYLIFFIILVFNEITIKEYIKTKAYTKNFKVKDRKFST